jgi:hypothetical protein
MPVTEDTYKIQSGLASYCRTNVEADLPGLTENRVQQYRRLVYNVIDDTFDGAFPVTRKLLSDTEWHELVNHFFSHHACQTPSVWKLPFEFYEYICATDLEIKKTYPFITNLLYFEWLEIEVHTMPDEPSGKFRMKGDWLNDKIVINKEFRLVQLSYPVHQLKPEELKKDKREGNYFVLIFREPDTGNVQFFDLSPLYAYLVSQLAETEKNIHTIVDDISVLFAIERNPDIEKHVVDFLNHLAQKKFIFGFAHA